MPNIRRRLKHRTKVFCIGYNKTGTTTLEAVLKGFGYRMPRQSKQEAKVVEKMFMGDYKPLFRLCQKYDAFQDMPFSQEHTYIALDSRFPNSKFILTIRDPNDWFDSMVRFHLQRMFSRVDVNRLEDFGELAIKDKSIYLHKNYVYNVLKKNATEIVDHEVRINWALVHDRSYRIDRYDRRNQEILRYFYGRTGKLLVLDLSRETDNSRLVEFLNLPTKYIDKLPHLNKSQVSATPDS